MTTSEALSATQSPETAPGEVKAPGRARHGSCRCGATFPITAFHCPVGHETFARIEGFDGHHCTPKETP
jgi:hypothetical protein